MKCADMMCFCSSKYMKWSPELKRVALATAARFGASRRSEAVAMLKSVYPHEYGSLTESTLRTWQQKSTVKSMFHVKSMSSLV